MSRALYRTYRSKSFDEIIGQSHVTDLLKNAIASGKIAHAYLLTGPRGVGKTSVARIIAHAVNGLEYSEDPHLDIIEIDAASNRRIDDIRDLRDKVHIGPVSATYKVYIIDEVHMLTGESFNALLKTLEEPPQHAIFILATTEVHKLPATIISRTQRFHFRPASTTDTVSHLVSIADKESISVEKEALELIALHANGSFRDSVSLLDQLSGLSQNITAELVESVLGMAARTKIKELANAVEASDIDTVVSCIESVQAAGVSPITLTEQLSRELLERAKKNHQLYQLLDSLTDIPKAHDPELKLLATLVRYSKPQGHKTLASATTKPATVAAKPTQIRSQMIERQSKEKLASDSSPEHLHPTPATKQTAVAIDWTQVLAMVQKHHAPLYSVLSRATTSYDTTTNCLSLQFAYALHRKKLENPVYKKQLGAVIYDLYSLEPELVITDTKSAASLDKDALAVAAIMGGGEPIRGTI